MIFSVQILRGVAALMVVVAHVQSNLGRFDNASDLSWLASGVGGVDIFFVISGFIIWCTSQSPDTTTKNFIVRRAVRIVPLYWLITSVIVAVALAAPAVLNSTRFDLAHVLASYAFVAYPHPVLNDPFPILVPGWSLNFEAFFYVVFGLALALPGRILAFCATSAVLLVLVLLGFLLRPASPVSFFYTDPIMLEFVFGLCVGVLYTHGPKLPLWLATSAVGLGVLGIGAAAIGDLVTDHHVRFLAAGIPAAVLVLGMTAAKRHHIDPKPAFPVLLGDASYSIYLTHVLVVPVVSRLWAKLNIGYSPLHTVLFILCAVGLAVTVGIAVHRLIERPMIEFFRKIARRRARQNPDSLPLRNFGNPVH